MSSPSAAPQVSSGNNVAKFGGIMAASILLSRILGMLRDTVLVSQFGIGLDADAYRLAVQIPDIIFMLIAGGGLSSAFIPIFSDLIHKNEEEEAWKVFGAVVTICSVIAVALIAIAWALSPAIVGFFQGKHPDSVLPPAIYMSRVMLPAQFAFLIGSLLLATLFARKHFAAPGLAPNVYNVGIIVGGIVLHKYYHLGIESMAWGAVAGAMLGNLVIPALSMAKVGSHFRPSFDYKRPGVKKFFVLLLPVILGFSLPSMVNIITQKFASAYGNEGINTVLSLSNNLMQAPLGIFGQSLALAAFPVLAEYVAKGRMDLYRKQISKTLRTVLYLGIPAAALMLALAPQIVNVLYGYGKGTGTDRLDWISDCLRIYSLAIFAWCMQPVLMRGFFSLHKTKKPVILGTAMTFLFIVLALIGLQVSKDFRMLPWVTNIAAVLLAIILFKELEKEVGRLDRMGIARTLAKSTVAGAVACGASFGAMALIHPQHKLQEISALFFIGLGGVWIYYFITKFFNMPETEYISRATDKITRRFGR